eukprot:362362_1
MYHESDIVLLHGLKSKPTWNGKKATIMGPFQWSQARYPIQIMNNNNNNDMKEEYKLSDTNLTALIKPSNLKLISRNKIHDDAKESLFEIQFIDKERRYGIFALKDIASGTIIIKETPILSLPKEQFRNGQSSEEYINKQFELLSNNNQQKVLKLHNNMNNNKIHCVGVYRTN